MEEEILKSIELDVASCGDKHQRELRRKALMEYYTSPNYCKYCGKVIMVLFKNKVAYARIKKFCNRSCAAIFNNSSRIRVIKPKVEKVINNPTKEALFARRKNWQSARSSIAKNARETYDKSDKPKKCLKCGYDKHYEICHIRSVSSFPEETLISEINNLDNLIALCPNCHWEFDNLLT